MPLYVPDDNRAWRTLLTAGAAIGPSVATGIKLLGYASWAATAGQTTGSVAIIRLGVTRYPVIDGLTAKLRLSSVLGPNATSLAQTMTVGLYPLTATGGAAGGVTYTAGTLLAGSSLDHTAGASTFKEGESAEFNMPADDYYAVGFSFPATSAASSWSTLTALLQLRHT